MSEAALVTTTEYDRTVKDLRAWITRVENKVDVLRAEFNQFKIDIRSELATAVANINQQLVGNRAYTYGDNAPYMLYYQDIPTANTWEFIDLYPWWVGTGIVGQPTAVRIQAEAMIGWYGPLEGPDGTRYFTIEFSSAAGGGVGQNYYGFPIQYRGMRVSGAKDDSTYTDSSSCEMLVPVFFLSGRPYVRRFFGSSGGPVFRLASIKITGWKY